MTELEDLVPEIRTCTDGSPSSLSLEEWTRRVCSFGLAVGYSTLFWPRFHVVCDSVVRHGFDEAHFAVWLGQHDGDVAATEQMLNHVHVVSLAHRSGATLERVLHLGRVIRDATAAKLALDDPDRRFVVTFDEPDPSDLSTAEITFWEDRSRR